MNGLICFPYDKINKEIIQSAENLKVISTYSVGYDHIDTQFAKEKKIRVGYTPEVLTDATADMAFGLLIDLLRRISEGDRLIRKGNWKQIYGAYPTLYVLITLRFSADWKNTCTKSKSIQYENNIPQQKTN